MSAYLIQTFYIIGTLFFIFGLKKISSPEKPDGGLLWAGVGILMIIIATYFYPQVLSNFFWITVALLVGGTIAFVISNTASISNIPKMIALYSAMGAGAATAVAAIELSKLGTMTSGSMTDTFKTIGVAGAMVGSVSLSASLLTFARLQGTLKRSIHLPMHQWLNALLLVVALTFGFAIIFNGSQFEFSSLIILLAFALILGIFSILPIANSDMPTVISVLNGLTGLAIGLTGYVVGIPAIMIAGIMVAAACFVLSKKLTKAKNKSLLNVLFGDKNSSSNQKLTVENLQEVTAEDASVQMAFAKTVIVIPGFGMAVSQAQGMLSELTKQLSNKGVNIKFAIHPAAGRMPGHMNLLLADAGISYDDIFDLDEINNDFSSTDIVLIIGGNDIVNSSANTDKQSPIFGTQILNADQAKQVIVIKRSNGVGFSNIENPLFYKENTSMLYGDAQIVLAKVVSNIKSL